MELMLELPCGGKRVLFNKNEGRVVRGAANGSWRARFRGSVLGFLESWIWISSFQMYILVSCRYAGSFHLCIGLEPKSGQMFHVSLGRREPCYIQHTGNRWSEAPGWAQTSSSSTNAWHSHSPGSATVTSLVLLFSALIYRMPKTQVPKPSCLWLRRLCQETAVPGQPWARHYLSLGFNSIIKMGIKGHLPLGLLWV